MAFEAYDEYEQSEIVRRWLRQNGLSIVVGIVLGLAGVYAWQKWQAHKVSNELQAAQLYREWQMLSMAGGNTGDALVEKLKKEHADSAYAVFASIELAQRELKSKQNDQALATYQWAEQHAAEPALKALVEVRLAVAQLGLDRPNDALATLDRIPAKTFTATVEELRGDAQLKLKRPDQARKSYQAAIAAMGKDAPQRDAVQMKLDDLAVAGSR